MSLLLAGLAVGAAHQGARSPMHRDSHPPAQRPNILFILVDYMGFGDLSVTGNDRIATPAMDRLAAEGLLMTQFYDPAPICSPSRVGFFTGRFPARDRFVTFEDTHAHNARTGQADWLDLSVPTLAESLHGAGYATGHFGKWHMGGGRDIGDAPLPAAYGFDESYTQFEGLGPRVLPTNVDGEMARLAKQSSALGHGQVDWCRRGEITARYVDYTLDFIARHANGPWFVQLWPDDVHAPWLPDADQRAQVAGGVRDPNQEAFLGVLAELDRQVGRLIETLRAKGQLDDTLVVLTSDNGPNSVGRFYQNGANPPGSSGPYRGRKDSLYEGGIRQPLIVRWRGQILAGRRDNRTIGHGVDLFPTLAMVAGARRPAGLDGIDLGPAWRGRPIASRPDLFWTYGAFGARADSPRPFLARDTSPSFAIRRGRWKLLADADGLDAQLYDLVDDAEETHDLARAMPALTRSLALRLVRWQLSLPLRATASVRRVTSNHAAIPLNPIDKTNASVPSSSVERTLGG